MDGAMTIRITKVGSKYDVEASPPHVDVPWHSVGPMTAQQVVSWLQELGCHTTDISDAFRHADPFWLNDMR